MKKYFFFDPESYYTPDIEPYVDKKTFLSEFNSLIFQEEVKAERVASIFIFASVLFGFLITYKYEIYLLGFGGGGLGLLAYFIGKKFFPYTYAQKILNQTILQWFILQYIAQMHGLYEMHFTFFPITTMLIVYRDLFVFLLTGLLPVAQHLILFALQLGMGYDLREYFINIENLTVEIMFYHLLVATLHLIIVGFFCVFFRDKIAFQYKTFLKQKYMERLIIEEQKKAIENQFVLIDSYSRFVPDQLLSMLQKQVITEVQLGDSTYKEMAILFSDIRSFTTLSESLKPQEIFEFINSYLKVMVPIIRKHNGFVDKFLGDGIMALFPLKFEDAIRAGLEMLEGLKKFNEARKSQNLSTIEIGIGIHVGMQMLGVIGESHRLEATVVSDVVNTASRLEGLTKVFGSPLLVSEEALKAVENIEDFKFRKLGNVTVKGRSKTVSIYEVVPDWKISEVNGYQNGVLCFELVLDYYQRENYESAIQMFEKALSFIPEDKASIFYLKECKQKLNELSKIDIID